MGTNDIRPADVKGASQRDSEMMDQKHSLKREADPSLPPASDTPKANSTDSRKQSQHDPSDRHPSDRERKIDETII